MVRDGGLERLLAQAGRGARQMPPEREPLEAPRVYLLRVPAGNEVEQRSVPLVRALTATGSSGQ
jgi:hypothetical protein